MVLFARMIGILSRQSRLMVATLSSFAASLALSHCSNCSEKEDVDADDWLWIVFCCGRRCDTISESIDIADRRRHFGMAKES
ncbi:hypothetical protein BLNAU_8012 [Blattamonas nauphoetae]|uniref:Secreted protein n=1 Tax=Blattamonas nauphoetae TaxID=2049346 RepID=A0ABQ9XZN6_9EUKA|nr:hypothetical protein BLNAU_8012 [Blattamonas nauphoetae]